MHPRQIFRRLWSSRSVWCIIGTVVGVSASLAFGTENDEIKTILNYVAPIATALGVIVAAWQLNATREVANTNFEDVLSREYRALTSVLPLEALLGKMMDPDEIRQCLPYFYRYVDLVNEQIFLRQQGRIQDKTWDNWCVGIRTNLHRHAFAAAWEMIRSDSGTDFGELRWLIKGDYQTDPLSWGRKHIVWTEADEAEHQARRQRAGRATINPEAAAEQPPVETVR